jgi:ABC-type transport system involved in multi-copper enzyme maturation permease subunit
MITLRQLSLIAWTIFIESVRRKEIYVVVIVALLMILSLRFVRWFDVEGLGKFYREIALTIMNYATGLTVILLAARQLPREFKNRTLYPLLAKPVSRVTFILGKFIGVLLGAAFCYALFMTIFIFANVSLRAEFNVVMLIQAVYLQLLGLAVIAALSFLLSVLLNTDAAITIGVILYGGSQVMMNAVTLLSEHLDPIRLKVAVALLYIVPQMTLFDASSRVVHGREGRFEYIETSALFALTAYGLFYTALFLGLTYVLFRRKAL